MVYHKADGCKFGRIVSAGGCKSQTRRPLGPGILDLGEYGKLRVFGLHGQRLAGDLIAYHPFARLHSNDSAGKNRLFIGQNRQILAKKIHQTFTERFGLKAQFLM